LHSGHAAARFAGRRGRPRRAAAPRAPVERTPRRRGARGPRTNFLKTAQEPPMSHEGNEGNETPIVPPADGTNAGKVTDAYIEEEMKRSYLRYSMSVIVSRALPDVRDGLKPVHRRVLYGMDTMSLYNDKPYKKSATIVGEVMGKYHPHGDASIYDTLV